jgi:hypothetical protein
LAMFAAFPTGERISPRALCAARALAARIRTAAPRLPRRAGHPPEGGSSGRSKLVTLRLQHHP